MKQHEQLRKKLEELSKGDLKKNEELYQETVDAYIQACNEDEEITTYNFRELTFPKISFYKVYFIKAADFGGTTFSGDISFIHAIFLGEVDFISATFLADADFNSVAFSINASFRDATFSGEVYFSYATFSGEVSFREATFSTDAYFREAVFSDEAYFISATFSGYADFSYASFFAEVSFREAVFSGDASFSLASFSAEAYFSYVTYSGEADFRSSTFLGSANFISATFSADTDFSEAKFEQRTFLDNCSFYDELHFESAKFAFLKLPPSHAGEDEYKPIRMDSTILEAAHLWSIDTLNHYSFKNAFILGVSLAGKSLNNCNFTGAVMKRVFTDGWNPDEETIKNTSYIYTDYRVVDKKDVGGNIKKMYVPLEESRVPADGFFGKGSNAGFTIKEYFYKPHEWNYALDLPAEMRTTILNAVQFFREYAEKAKNEHVDIETRTEGSKLRVIFQVESEEDRERVEGLFKEYVEKLFSVDEFIVEFENPSLEEYEKAELQRRTTFLQNSTLIETAHQMQLTQGAKEKFEEFLLPIVQAEDRIMTYSMRLLESAGKIGTKQVTAISAAKANAEAFASAKATQKTEITYKLGDFIDALDALNEELGERKVKRIQEDLEDVIKEVRANKEAEAKSRWEVTWSAIREITDFASKFPKVYELGHIVQNIFMQLVLNATF